MLQEGEGYHRHERMAVKTLPGSPFEVIEAEFLFHLLMRLLANPSCLDGSSQSAQIGRSRQIGEIVFPLSRQPVFADEPNLVPRQMLLTLVPDPLRWSVGDPHADGGKASFELAFRPGSPTHSLPLGIGQHVFGCVSIEYLGRAADVGGRAWQRARSSARRRDRP